MKKKNLASYKRNLHFKQYSTLGNPQLTVKHANKETSVHSDRKSLRMPVASD